MIPAAKGFIPGPAVRHLFYLFALGQKLTFGRATPMSELPSKADISRREMDVR